MLFLLRPLPEQACEKELGEIGGGVARCHCLLGRYIRFLAFCSQYFVVLRMYIGGVQAASLRLVWGGFDCHFAKNVEHGLFLPLQRFVGL